jgi:hypothetical protein
VGFRASFEDHAGGISWISRAKASHSQVFLRIGYGEAAVDMFELYFPLNISCYGNAR